MGRHRIVPEQLLPLRLVSDDAVDIAALYRAHAATVGRWARRFGGPGIDDEDVVQEVFLLANRRLDRWEPGAKITTWLFRATEKIARRARQRHRLRQLFVRAFGVGSATTSVPAPSALDQMVRDDTCRQVYAILDRLPERHRRVLILFELEAMSTQEIADLIGVRLPTVRVWLFRARARFAELGRELRPSQGNSRGKSNGKSREVR
jgi:RNA polymerase sigma factor (sigma-70 family)